MITVSNPEASPVRRKNQTVVPSCQPVSIKKRNTGPLNLSAYFFQYGSKDAAFVHLSDEQLSGKGTERPAGGVDQRLRGRISHDSMGK